MEDFRIDGYLNSTRTTIYVDQYQYENFHERYRFTLAHELGHHLIHKEIYESQSFESFDEYLNWMQSVSNNELYWIEWQGRSFAGLVLVPGPELFEISQEIALSLPEENLFSAIDSREMIWSYLAEKIAPVFEVSPDCIERRITKDRIPEKVLFPFDNRK